MSSLSQELAKFVIETKFDDLPEDVVHEGKRSLLDSIGCAIAGITTDKGKIAVTVAKRLGGPQESSIIGVGDKVSCSNAAFANGELVNGLDYDAVPHLPPIIVPPSLAMAESVKASGQDLILATVSIEAKRKDPRSWLARVEVTAKGKTYAEKRMYAKGTSFTDLKATDQNLVEKFRDNASTLLTQNKIDKAVLCLLELEKLDDISALMNHITL